MTKNELETCSRLLDATKKLRCFMDTETYPDMKTRKEINSVVAEAEQLNLKERLNDFNDSLDQFEQEETKEV